MAIYLEEIYGCSHFCIDPVKMFALQFNARQKKLNYILFEVHSTEVEAMLVLVSFRTFSACKVVSWNCGCILTELSMLVEKNNRVCCIWCVNPAITACTENFHSYIQLCLVLCRVWVGTGKNVSNIRIYLQETEVLQNLLLNVLILLLLRSTLLVVDELLYSCTDYQGGCKASVSISSSMPLLLKEKTSQSWVYRL